jgi:hypothetical protein
MPYIIAEIKARGWNALVKELEHAGGTKFILLYEPGEGNYTKERRELFKGIKIEEMLKDIEKLKQTKN